jgi:hypothetical protein
MAQQIINVGAVANDRTGDTWRDAFVKVNANDTELYTLLGENNTVYLREEADLPNQTATTWTMDPGVPYKLAASFSTSLQCIPAAGSSFRGDNLGGFTMSYTGTGAMFLGSDVDFYIRDLGIDPGITNTAFDFTDTVGSVRRFIAENVSVHNCAIFGKFTDMLLAQVFNSNSGNAAQGLQFFGTSGTIWSVSRLALTSTSATFKGLDLGTATAPVVEIDDLLISAPSGAVGISGLANSGNIPVGSLARVSGCEFFAPMTDLQNITTDDIRWSFDNNTPTQDTQPDALTSFSGNATETVIAASSTDGSNAVLVAGTWVEVEVSQFSSTSAGRITYLGQRPLKGPVDASLGLIASGGGSLTAKVYIFKNGSVIAASGIDFAISGSVSASISLPWQITFAQNDYIELFVENQTNTTNIIVDHAVWRVL